jgi:hypothetical protein
MTYKLCLQGPLDRGELLDGFGLLFRVARQVLALVLDRFLVPHRSEELILQLCALRFVSDLFSAAGKVSTYVGASFENAVLHRLEVEDLALDLLVERLPRSREPVELGVRSSLSLRRAVRGW